MLSYIYDGTFDGFLTAVREAIKRQEFPEQIVTEEKLERNLFSETRVVRTDFEKAKDFLSNIVKKLSREGLKTVLYCYLSEEPGSETTLCEYLQKVMAAPGRIEDKLADPVVLKVQRMGDKVVKEVHRFKGIVRFREIEPGFFYAPIEPDHHITPLLASHFRNRFADQKWFIHDRCRDVGIFFDGTRAHFLKEFDLNPKLEQLTQETAGFSEHEIDCQDLWNIYFKNIEIKERRNLKLQKRHLPSRYWRYLVEDIGKNASNTIKVF